MPPQYLRLDVGRRNQKIVCSVGASPLYFLAGLSQNKILALAWSRPHIVSQKHSLLQIDLNYSKCWPTPVFQRCCKSSKSFAVHSAKIRCSVTISVPFKAIALSRKHGGPQKFMQGGKVNILLIIFRLLTMQCQWTFTKRFTLVASQRKCAMLRQQSQKCASLAAVLVFHSCFYNTVKLDWLLLSEVTVSLHYLPQMPAFNSHMRQSACFRKLK